MKFWHLFLFLLLSAAAPATAQSVRGSVVSLDSTRLAGVTVLLYSETGELAGAAVTDVEGGFEVQLSEDRPYLLVARHVGYTTVEADNVRPSKDETLLITLQKTSIVLGEVLVEAQVALEMQAFLNRSATRYGRFFSVDQHGWRAGGVRGVTNRVPFLSMGSTQYAGEPRIVGRTFAGGSCTPTVFVDGNMIYQDPIAIVTYPLPDELRAVEVYRSPVHAPEPYQSMSLMEADQCAVVMMWTYRTMDR